MARGAAAEITVMVMSKQTSISDDTTATAAHYSGQLFWGAEADCGGSQSDFVRAAPFFLSFFFFWIPESLSMWSQSRPLHNNALDPHTDTRWPRADGGGEVGVHN